MLKMLVKQRRHDPMARPDRRAVEYEQWQPPVRPRPQRRERTLQAAHAFEFVGSVDISDQSFEMPLEGLFKQGGAIVPFNLDDATEKSESVAEHKARED